MTRRMILIGFAVALLTGISTPPSRAENKNEAAIRAADVNWNKVFNAKDMDNTLKACADNASILAPNAPRAAGREAIRALFAGFHALPELSITWAPTEVRVASSGDLGYSSGAYQMSFKDPAGQTISDHGKYVTIWEKQKGGDWKVVLDAFNSDVPLPAAP